MTAPGAACGCCSGVAARTPLEVANRPGLSAVAYRVGTHPDFLASLLAGLTDAGRPALADLATRDADDFSLALLDAWAVAADVLTFYGERLANEAFLRTATHRESLVELGRLIDYRLRPGVAARAHLAFALEPPPQAAPAASKDPGSAPPVTPRMVRLEAGLRVQSIPGPGEQPQTFETVEDVDAHPEWNALPAATTVASVPGLGDTEAWLEGTALGLKPGDAFLLAGSDIVNDRWDVRLLTAVEPRDDLGRTRVAWKEELGSVDPPKLSAGAPQAYVLRKRVGAFGHNAPMWGAMSREFREDYPGATEGDTRWPGYEICSEPGTVVDLDGSHPDVVAGSLVVLSKPSYRELWRVAEVTELSRAEFAVSGKVTRLTLEGGENYELFRTAVRTLTVFAASQPLALAEAPDPSPVSGGGIVVDGDAAGLPGGRRVVVRGVTTSGADHAEVATLAGVEPAGGRLRLVLEEPLSSAYQRPSVVVHANVARATHGETVAQLLGSGQAAAAFQRFALAHDPLTYVATASSSGAASTLEVRVNDVAWEQVPTLYGTGPGRRAYAVRTDEQGATVVQFGDGAHGARLPSGANNVRARYRKGLGAAGNVGARALAQLLDRPLGVKGVANPLAAGGGTDPEPVESARASMPLTVRTLGRAVSLLDYEDFARAFAGVAKAHAAVLPLQGGRTVVVTVALESPPGPDTVTRLGELGTALRNHGDPHVPVLVLPHAQATFRLALRVVVDPAREADAVIAGVEAALRSTFSFAARGFTEPVHRSDVVVVAHAVAGVVAVDVDRLYVGITPALASRLAAQRPAVASGATALPAGLLLLDPGPLDWLQVMT